jgi:hypothetical protein
MLLQLPRLFSVEWDQTIVTNDKWVRTWKEVTISQSKVGEQCPCDHRYRMKEIINNLSQKNRLPSSEPRTSKPSVLQLPVWWRTTQIPWKT